MASGPSTNQAAAQPTAPQGDSWLTPSRIALIAMLVLCALLALLRLYEANEQAEAQGTVALALIEQNPAPKGKEAEEHLSRALAAAAQPNEPVLALSHCRGEQCRAMYARPDATPCGAKPSWQTLCHTVPSTANTGDSLVVSYDLQPALLSALLDTAVTVLLSGGVLLVWRRAMGSLKQDKTDAAPQKRQATDLDALTGLLNRVAFEAAVKKHNETPSAGSSGTDGCLMYFDLDRFKIINDTHGHIAGDRVLKTVSNRLRYTLGNDVVIGRLGGDEFAALMTDVSSPAHIEKMCRVLIEQVSKPIQMDGIKDWVGLSIGAFMLKRGELSVGEMLHRADLAMYEAKRAGRGRLVFYDDAMSEAALTRAQIQADLKAAIEERQLFMVYQPQFDAHDSIRGVESLVRWKHPTLGLIPPERFIPIAEQSGLIVPLGKMIVDMVCADLVALRAERLALPYVSMDVSLRQLADSALVDDVQEALQRHGLTSTDIEFEVTESTAMVGHVGKENATLKMLAARSFRIAIDDFGTGYSSMGRLLDLKVDKLKIDGVFVAAIGKPSFNPALLELMISLANRLGVKSVAEGVETAEQVRWLRQAGCQMMQGDFYAKPMTHGQLIHWMRMQEGDRNFENEVWSPTLNMEEAGA
jgi:diguanylate cyclase (GGDEF)-like protein